jgi:hypothetical protein
MLKQSDNSMLSILGRPAGYVCVCVHARAPECIRVCACAHVCVGGGGIQFLDSFR